MLYYLAILLRIAFAPLILIWPLQAIIVSFLLDLFDADFAHYIVSKKQYQLIDKVLDTWVYIFELILAWRLFPDFKLLLLLLFIWRLIGVILFFFNSYRWLFVIFGNYFEIAFFVLYFKIVFININITLINAFLIKLFNEWFIHVADFSIRENFFRSKRKWRSV